jgi:hypothetical protein
VNLSVWERVFLALGLSTFWIVLLVFASLPQLAVSADEPETMPAFSLTETLYLPLVFHGYVPPQGRLCRFGVGAGQSIADYDVNSLKLGWYIDWTATVTPARPGKVEYMPMVRLHQTGVDTYSYSPDVNVLQEAALNQPGATWLIGNEPDRRRYQDNLEPRVYARAYHDLYALIKGMDPTARIAAGGIVQPTPLRLQYLDLVLQGYQDLYGVSMPVDVWNIHAFILRERSCAVYPDDCWGAEIPPGIDAAEGELYGIQDNDNIEIFQTLITNFRQWMSDNGYQNCPLIITEFGVQMPEMYGFTPERVNAYMDAAFDYLRTVTATTGYPADEYRFVQQWAWYSLTDNAFNGWLFNPDSKQRTVFGDHFAIYTEQVQPVVNLVPVDGEAETVSRMTSGEGITLTLSARVANNGNFGISVPFTVAFYDGDPAQGGQLIGSEQISGGVGGCAALRSAQVTWYDVPHGSHSVYVAVDPENTIYESDELDNVKLLTVIEVANGAKTGKFGEWLQGRPALP